jgi:DNA repair exonuclease SbcCD ATPase subunit
MTTKQELENELKQGLKKYKDKLNDLENKFIEKQSQTDPVEQKMATEKINNLKTTLTSLEKELDALQRIDQQEDMDKVKKGIKSIIGDIDEEFRSSLAYFH